MTATPPNGATPPPDAPDDPTTSPPQATTPATAYLQRAMKFLSETKEMPTGLQQKSEVLQILQTEALILIAFHLGHNAEGAAVTWDPASGALAGLFLGPPPITSRVMELAAERPSVLGHELAHAMERFPPEAIEEALADSADGLMDALRARQAGTAARALRSFIDTLLTHRATQPEETTTP